MLISIAWRNLWRHKLRSATVMIAVTIGLSAGLFSVAFMVGMVEERLESAIGNQVGNIQIHNNEFIAEEDFSYLVVSPGKITKYLYDKYNIDKVSKRLLASGMITSPTTASGVKIIAVDAEKERRASTLYKRTVDGDYLPDDFRNPVYIGEKLAEDLSVSLRSRIVLSFQDPLGHITGGAFRVAGIFKTEDSVFDSMNVFVRKGDFVTICSHDLDEVHEIVIRIEDDSRTHEIVNDINARFSGAGIKARGWQTIKPDLGMIMEMMGQMMYILMAIILFALAFTIINTMLMAVMERFHEFGMLMAVGMKKTKVFIMVMTEALFLSLTGAFIGMVISYLAIFHTSRRGIDISSVAEGMEAAGYSAVIYPSISFNFYIGVTLLVVLTSIIASIYPAFKALRLNPAEAVRVQ